MGVEIQFKCSREKTDFFVVNSLDKNIWIEGEVNGEEFAFVFDITTAIKLSKTIRTEINKAKEVTNG
jgi:hypothetical protein